MKKVRTDCDREKIKNLEGYENFENCERGEKKKRFLKGMKILKIEKLSRFFEKNSLKKLGQPSLKKK
jgi:hypothetical protein